jgi:hypothetical protein
LNLGEFLSLGDEVSRARLRVINDADELLRMTIAEMELLAKESGEQHQQVQQETDSCRQAQRALELRWLQAESQVANLMSQAVHAINTFVTDAEFQIGQFEMGLQTQIAQHNVTGDQPGTTDEES